jgi:hypothetical protein
MGMTDRSARSIAEFGQHLEQVEQSLCIGRRPRSS